MVKQWEWRSWVSLPAMWTRNVSECNSNTSKTKRLWVSMSSALTYAFKLAHVGSQFVTHSNIDYIWGDIDDTVLCSGGVFPAGILAAQAPIWAGWFFGTVFKCGNSMIIIKWKNLPHAQLQQERSNEMWHHWRLTAKMNKWQLWHLQSKMKIWHEMTDWTPQNFDALGFTRVSKLRNHTIPVCDICTCMHL